MNGNQLYIAIKIRLEAYTCIPHERQRKKAENAFGPCFYALSQDQKGALPVRCRAGQPKLMYNQCRQGKSIFRNPKKEKRERDKTGSKSRR
jgi:hypothetical protein